MNYNKWVKEFSDKNQKVVEARKILEDATDERDEFLRETLGMAPGEVASLEGTAKMVGLIVDMKMKG